MQEAKIYKSQFRGVLSSENWKILSTFNYQKYQEISRKPFGNLLVWNDETLNSNSEITHQITGDCQVLIIPIVGAIDFESKNYKEFITINQLQIFDLEKNDIFKISNPYKNELVNYLHIQFQKNQDLGSNSFQNNFDLSQKNQLIPIFENKFAKGFIGIYNGRKEEIYKLQNSKKNIFAYIISGAFELENRLLEAGDGLSLSDLDTVEFEALSENAILLVLEI